MRRGLLVVLLAGMVAAILTATGNTSGDKTSAATDHAAAGTSVTISNEQGATWTCGFNPLSADLVDWSFGPVYESLVFVDELKSGAATPWLASKYAWSNHNKTITFTIRPGVKWSDGKPLTAADVALHLPADQEKLGARPSGRLVGVEERDQQRQQGRLQVQDRRGAILLLRRRPATDRAPAHLEVDQEPGQLQGSRTRSAVARSR